MSSRCLQGQWLCPTCVFEGHAPVQTEAQQRKVGRGRVSAAPRIDMEGLTIEELREAAADPLLSVAQRKAAKAQLRALKQQARQEKIERR